jgi:hypothetical protein
MIERLADIAVILGILSSVLGFLWRRHKVERRLSNLDHMKELERENKEMDDILDRMGANNVYSTKRDDRSRVGNRPQERGVRDPERDHRSR